MPPVTLTRAQFLAKKPKGHYGKYLAYIGAHRPPPDPLMAQASAMVAAGLAPIKAQYDWAAKQRMRDAMAASAAAKGFAGAYTKSVAAIPNTAGSAYEAAAQALAGYSGGLQGRAQDIADTAGRAASEDVARLSGMDLPMPSAVGALSVPAEMEKINVGTFVGRAPLVTRALNALTVAERGRLADWADIQRYKGVQEAAAIRDKYLTETQKSPALLQQTYLALQKNAREAAQLDLLKDQLELKRLQQRVATADSKAARAAAIRALDIKQAELDAKVAGEGYYHKYPPKPTRDTTFQKNKAKRLTIFSDISADKDSIAKKFALNKYGRPFPGMNSAKLRKHLIAVWWPKLKSAGAGKPAHAQMLKLIDALIAEMEAQNPSLAGKTPATAGSGTSVLPPG